MEGQDTSSPKVSEFEKDTLLRLVLVEMRVFDIYRKLDEIQRKMQKLDDVYYHIFPDRMERDRQFEEQLRQLNVPGDPSTPR